MSRIEQCFKSVERRPINRVSKSSGDTSCRASPTFHSPYAWPPPSGCRPLALLLVTVLALQRVRDVPRTTSTGSRRATCARSRWPARSASTCSRSAASRPSTSTSTTATSKTQDRIAAEIEAMSTDAQGDAKRARGARRGRREHGDASRTQAVAWGKALNTALARSRAETVSGAEDRSGSRDLYTGADLARDGPAVRDAWSSSRTRSRPRRSATAAAVEAEQSVALAPAADRRRRLAAARRRRSPSSSRAASSARCAR